MNGQYTSVAQTVRDGEGAQVAITSKRALMVVMTDPATGAPVSVSGGEYETVAASQTAQVLGATGAIGDYLSHLLVIPATTSPGLVTLLDGATSIPVFVGGASSVLSLIPFPIPIGANCTGAGWKVTTGANVSVVGVGQFT